MGCVHSVDDKGQAGTWKAAGQGASSGHWAADAGAAVAEMLGGTASSTPVEISVKCQKLPNKDLLSLSDPMAVLLVRDSQGRWTEAGRTDVVANSLNPAFCQPLVVSYLFETLQRCRLVVYDADVAGDPATLRLEDQDFLAEGSFYLSDLLTAHGQMLSIQLSNEQGRLLPGCTATLVAEEIPNTFALVTLALGATKLDNKDAWGKSDPFVRISKAREGGAWVPVLKTEVIKNNLNPSWAPFQASYSQLCNCDPQRPLLVEVFDADLSGAHDFIGACTTSLSQLQDVAAAGQPLPLVNPKKQGKAGYTNSGTLLVRSATVVPRPSFLDYIRGGCQLNFLCAIDFTASNRDPRDPNSLHSLLHPTTLYEDAIRAVGSVLEHYDSDKRFPAWGFGAALPPTNTTSHCFALNGSGNDPEVVGVEGIRQAYRQTLVSVKLSGPTLFAPIITQAAHIASQPTPHMAYYVLLILTDGCIMDMANTLRALVDASHLPLSLLIVGVGNEDFTAMDDLDGDRRRLRSPDGRVAARDIVQFVPLRPHQRETVESLTAQLLAELPGQMVEYFHDLQHVLPPARTGVAPAQPAQLPAPPAPGVAVAVGQPVGFPKV